MSQEQRFTAWFSDEERKGVEKLAKQHGTTMNFIVRMGVRQLLGLEVPAPLDSRERQPA